MNAERPNNLIEMPLEHYGELFREADPIALSAKLGVPFEDGCFKLHFLNREVHLSHPEMKAVYADTLEETAPKVVILLSRFLLNGEKRESTGKMLSYQEVPWGMTYLTQFKGRCIMRLAFGFGRDAERFKKACEGVGGVPAKGGDAAYDIALLPGLKMRFILWEGDEEFPPSAQILFSDNFQYAFTAEDMAVCGDLTLDAMKRVK